MTAWDLNRLRYTIRRITGKLDASQIPDTSYGPVTINNPAGLDDYINDYYLYDLDEVFRTMQLKTNYKFTTQQNVGVYNLPTNLLPGDPLTKQVYFSADSPMYVDGYEMSWFQDPTAFKRLWPELHTIQKAVATGNGGTSYTFTLNATPIQQGTVLIGMQAQYSPLVTENGTDRLQTDTFTNPGNLISSITGLIIGTVDYLSGVVEITFTNPIPAGININAHYYPYVASRPRDCLFFQNQFFIKPIPNDAFQMEVIAYQQPTCALSTTALFNPTDLPDNQFTPNVPDGFTNTLNMAKFNEWWQMIAYGASRKIFIEEGDHDEVARISGYLDEQTNLAQRRLLRQLSNQRIQSEYAVNNQGITGNYPPYPYY
jgi:hypothetical protein